MSVPVLLIILKFFGAIIGVGASIFSIKRAYSRYRHQQRIQRLFEESRNGDLLPQFTKSEIKEAIKGYVEPKCSPVDPSNSDGEAYLSDIREPVFSYMDRITSDLDNRSYILLLADSGMGKTTFCINYRAHLQKTRPTQDVAVISLSNPECEKRIRKIEKPSECILILDALDEDAKAISRGRDRLNQVLSLSSDFQSVIITCRSQFFTDDSAIPVETPISIVSPRRLGQNQHAKLKRFYLSPFDAAQIRQYIDRNFPIWNIFRYGQRQRAFKLVSNIPELTVRPMLLERLPEIAKGDEPLAELFDLYEFMVSGWAARESRWIEPSKLLAVSEEIALSMYMLSGNQYARITKAELDIIANALIDKDPQWNHLSTRSLLNRDSEGKFKFAHKSIMEFFVVRAAIREDERAFASPWNSFMKELFISWGYSNGGIKSIDIAHRLLTGKSSRKAIMPLADYWARPAANSFPSFRLSASRRTSGQGSKRLAVPQWRESNITVTEEPNFTVVEDHEFFLKWRIIRNVHNAGVNLKTTFEEIQRISDTVIDQRLPSYDEFISLVEGIEICGCKELLPDGALYCISDSPGSRRHLLVSLGKVLQINPLGKVIDKERIISVTNRSINCYETGVSFKQSYAKEVYVEQLWLLDQ